MPIKIVNGSGTEISYLQDVKARFDDSVNKRGTASFGVVLSAGASLPINEGVDVYFEDGDGFLTFVDGTDFDFVDGSGAFEFVSGTTIWGGTVEGFTETDITKGSTTTRRVIYKCVDFDQMATRRVVAASYDNQTMTAIITDLHTNYLSAEGVTLGTVETGPTITRAVFNYVSVAKALDELMAITNGSFSWQIDKDKALQVRARNNTTAAFDLSSGNKPFLSFSRSKSRNKYRNTQYVRAGHDLTDSRAETQLGDGNKRSFTAEYEVGAAPVIAVDTGGGFSNKTVGVLGVDSGKQFYYNIGSPIFSQDTSETVLSATDKVKITYQGRFPIIVKAEDGDEITARAAAESGTGIYESIATDSSINDDDLALDKALGFLGQLGSIKDVITYTTDTAGLVAGALQNINLSDHNINADYLIESVKAIDRGDQELRYTVRALGGDAFGGWVRFYNDLLASGQDFTIRENETLVILATAADSMTMQDAPTTNTYSGAYTVNGVDTYINGFHVG